MAAYDGHPRLELFFDSPNTCATFVAMCIALLVFVFCRKGSPLRGTPLILFISIVICLLWFLLGMTYSRGGLVAAVVACCAIGFWGNVEKRFFWAAMLASLVLVLVPGIFDRAVSTVNVVQDKSISHRIGVYCASAMMIFDHPLWGIGKDNFGFYYSLWMQPEENTYIFKSAVNNYLNLGVSFGIIPFSIYVFLAIASTIAAFRTSVACSALGFSNIAFLVSGLFSFLLWGNVLSLISAAIIVFILCHAFYSRKLSLRFVSVSALASVVLSMVVLTVGFFVSRLGGIGTFDVRKYRETGMCVIRPVGEARGKVYYFPDKNESMREAVAKTIDLVRLEKREVVILGEGRDGWSEMDMDGLRPYWLIANGAGMQPLSDDAKMMSGAEGLIFIDPILSTPFIEQDFFLSAGTKYFIVQINENPLTDFPRGPDDQWTQKAMGIFVVSDDDGANWHSRTREFTRKCLGSIVSSGR